MEQGGALSLRPDPSDGLKKSGRFDPQGAPDLQRMAGIGNVREASAAIRIPEGAIPPVPHPAAFEQGNEAAFHAECVDRSLLVRGQRPVDHTSFLSIPDCCKMKRG